MYGNQMCEVIGTLNRKGCYKEISWEKGQVEYAIRLFRRQFLKKTNFYTIKGTDISIIQHSINNLPRKCLGFLTPCEAFAVASVCCCA